MKFDKIQNYVIWCFMIPFYHSWKHDVSHYSTHCAQWVLSMAKPLKRRFILVKLVNFWYLLHLPSFAFEPPTIRVFATFEYPHPSSGVSNRPLISVISDFVIALPPEGKKTVISWKELKSLFLLFKWVLTVDLCCSSKQYYHDKKTWVEHFIVWTIAKRRKAMWWISTIEYIWLIYRCFAHKKSAIIHTSNTKGKRSLIIRFITFVYCY